MFNRHNLPKSLINEAASLLNASNSDFDLPAELQEIVSEAARDYLMCPTQEDRRSIIEWHIEQVTDIKELDPQVVVNFQRAVEHAAINEQSGFEGGFNPKSPAMPEPKDSGSKTFRTPGIRTGQEGSEVVRRYLRLKGELPTETPAPTGDIPLVAKGKLGESVELNEMAPVAAVAARVVPMAARALRNPAVQQALVQGGTELVSSAAERLKKKINPEPEVQTNGVDYAPLLDVLSTLNEQELNAYFDIVTIGDGGMLSEEQAEQLYNALVEAEII